MDHFELDLFVWTNIDQYMIFCPPFLVLLGHVQSMHLYNENLIVFMPNEFYNLLSELWESYQREAVV